MENLKKIIKQFPKVGEVKEIKALTSGLINQTYLVKSVSPEEPDYVLQRINHLIFTNIEMLQHNIEVVTRHIRQACLHIKASYGSADGSPRRC